MTVPPSPTHDIDQIRESAPLFLEQGGVVELRALRTQQGTISGFFDNVESLVEAAVWCSGQAGGVYVTLNPVQPSLLPHSPNGLRPVVRGEATTDADIVGRRLILVDLDAVRPADVSSTDAEHEAALQRARECRDWLVESGSPSGSLVLADSGNGAHVLIRVDLPNDGEARELVRRLLRSLAARFNDDAVKVDVSVSNAARISKLYGTLTRKGTPTAERPHRLAQLLEVPTLLEIAPRALLEALAGPIPDRANGHVAGTRAAPPIPDVVPQGEGGVRGEGRNSTLASLAGTMRHRRLTADEMLPTLLATNNARCRPPLSEQEVREIAASIGRYPPGEARQRTGQAPVDVVLPFPTEALPASLRRLVEQGAEVYATSADFIAAPMLATAGAAIGNGVEIEIKRGWREGTNLYVALVGSPGSRKTPALALSTDCLHAIQQELHRLYLDEVTAYEQAMAEWDDTPRRDRRAQHMVRPVAPEYHHVLTTNATTEALAPMLATAGSILLDQEELSGWFGGMNQYRGGRGADRQFYLSAWTRRSVKVDRKGSAVPIIIAKPHVSVVGGIQPDLLGGLAGAEQRQDGFLDRILWAYPDPLPDRFTEDEISPEASRAADWSFQGLSQLRFLEPPLVVRFDAEAKSLWAEWYVVNAREIESGDVSSSLEGVWAKMPGQVARIATILHVLDAAFSQPEPTIEFVEDTETTPDPFAPRPAGGPAPEVQPEASSPDWVPDEISVDTLRAAIQLGEYFKSHARRVHRHIQRGPRDLQTKILAGIRGRGWMKQTAILEDVLHRNVPAEKLRAALEALEEAGLVEHEVRSEQHHPRVHYWRAAT